MPKLKVLSGTDVIKIFFLFGFTVKSQKGSHVKLVRITPEGEQTLSIPNQNELDKGTLKAIIRQASSYISENNLLPHFYSE